MINSNRVALPQSQAWAVQATLNPVIKVVGLTKQFNSERGVIDISFSLSRGEVLCVIGANGSGKTTLLRCLSLFEEWDSGTISIFDGFNSTEFMHGSRGSEVLRRRLYGRVLGTMFQDSRPWPHLNVIENVTLPLTAGRGLSFEEAQNRAHLILERLGLKERSSSKIHELSGGLQQRVALARALAQRPSILLLDEVTSALDPDWTEKVRLLIKDFSESGGSVILVSHQLGLVKRLANEVMFLDRGRIVERGRPEDILVEPQTQQLRVFLANA